MTQPTPSSAECSETKTCDLMEVIDGPFSGLLARIIMLDGDARCVVLLDWLQQEVRATFSYAELRRAGQ